MSVTSLVRAQSGGAPELVEDDVIERSRMDVLIPEEDERRCSYTPAVRDALRGVESEHDMVMLTDTAETADSNCVVAFCHGLLAMNPFELDLRPLHKRSADAL
ncbi:hypothetical protein MRB53_037045 [Persea americana]|nr:hypothetical protein MRB53_037045 [Persea americana]